MWGNSHPALGDSGDVTSGPWASSRPHPGRTPKRQSDRWRAPLLFPSLNSTTRHSTPPPNHPTQPNSPPCLSPRRTSARSCGSTVLRCVLRERGREREGREGLGEDPPAHTLTVPLALVLPVRLQPCHLPPSPRRLPRAWLRSRLLDQRPPHCARIYPRHHPRAVRVPPSFAVLGRWPPLGEPVQPSTNPIVLTPPLM